MYVSGGRGRRYPLRSRSRAASSMAASDNSTAPAASPSGTKLSWLATRAIRPVNPASTSVVMTPSDTPPVRLVSSAISTRPVAAAARSRSSNGSGASQRRSRTRQPTPSAASVRAARKLSRSPFPKVMIDQVGDRQAVQL